jgi:hypothetical protein
MSDALLPERKKAKLIVVAAFDRGEDGELFAVYGPAEQQHEERAIRTAKSLVTKHVGVIAWSRDAGHGMSDDIRLPSAGYQASRRHRSYQ